MMVATHTVIFKARIEERFKRTHHHCKRSGHRWTEHGPTTGYRVGNRLFKSEEKAIKERDELQAYYDKYPFEMPVSQREIDEAKRLGIKREYKYFSKSA